MIFNNMMPSQYRLVRKRNVYLNPGVNSSCLRKIAKDIRPVYLYKSEVI